MTLPLSTKLKVRAMVYVAGEAIPNFWPMRNFIHHNPLFGLEHLGFAEAVARGKELFHGRGFLSRAEYQRYLADGGIREEELQRQVQAYCQGKAAPEGVDLADLLTKLLTKVDRPVMLDNRLAGTADIAACLDGAPSPSTPIDADRLRALLHRALDDTRPVHDVIDTLYGTDIRNTLDELLIKSCLDFFDEDQSVWGMPGREMGLYKAWRQLALHNLRFKLRGLHIERIIALAEDPETMIVRIMEELKIPHEAWVGYFTRELTYLHGWAGFIRWRSRTKHYHWQNTHPADLVDLLAVRLSLSLALIQDSARHLPGQDLALDAQNLNAFIDTQTTRAFLQYELHSARILPTFALKAAETLAGGNATRIDALCQRYLQALRGEETARQAERLQALADASGVDISRLPEAALARLLELIGEFERDEGMIWLRAMEGSAMQSLLPKLDIQAAGPTDKRPFAQALFCIDTRSEPIRRQLESMGDYQTYGIAGFFGVPMSFIELGKGNETNLCPAVVTPKNLALEMSIDQLAKDQVLGALEHALHELKASVIAPFATVEAVGLIFGFDMFGKTLAPMQYHRWRRHLGHDKPATRLLLDKLTREQADSIVRAVQRAMVVIALKQEFHLADETLPDDAIRELREAALGDLELDAGFAGRLGLDQDRLGAFLQRLRTHYRVNPDETDRQMLELSRLGFSLREQTNFVATALSSIGLVENFSRFVLLVGHGSTSQNNPYESALDCGACGGNSGATSARALAYMANKPDVRAQLREQGIAIPDDTWFLPAMHNTTTDEIVLHEVELLPARHLLYADRLRKGLRAASRLCAQERMPTLATFASRPDADRAERLAHRNAQDWSQTRPEWGLARNAYFIIGRRELSQNASLDGRSFLHSYDWRIDPKQRLLENILTGPLVVAEWINMEHYFSAVDNEHYGSGSKAYHNVAGRFGVMSGNIGDLRTGLPAQTVLKDGRPYHEPIRLINVIEAPFEHATAALNAVASVKNLVHNGWVRLLIVDPETGTVHVFDDVRKEWTRQGAVAPHLESIAS